MTKPTRTLAGLTPEEVGFDFDAIEKKYQEEKAKRLRADGSTQYQDVEGAFKHLKLDTFTDSSFKRDPISTKIGALIVGAGYGGLLTAVRLILLGFNDIVIIEKGAGCGGTWFHNRYPGLLNVKVIRLWLIEEQGLDAMWSRTSISRCWKNWALYQVRNILQEKRF
jgi:hypothetical protein